MDDFWARYPLVTAELRAHRKAAPHEDEALARARFATEPYPEAPAELLTRLATLVAEAEAVLAAFDVCRAGFVDAADRPSITEDTAREWLTRGVAAWRALGEELKSRAEREPIVIALLLTGENFDSGAFVDSLPPRLRSVESVNGWISNYWLADAAGYEGALNRLLDAYEPHLKTATSLGATSLRFVIECKAKPAPDLAQPAAFKARLQKALAEAA